MAQWHKTPFPGVRFRKHPKRKHGIQPDRYFTITYKLLGKTRTEALGWASRGITAKESFNILCELKRNQKTGNGPQTLKEKRELANTQLRAREKAGTVESLFTAYCNHLRDEGKTSVNEVERALLTAINTPAAATVLGEHRAANSVTSRDIQRLLKSVHDRAPSMAAHLRAYLHGAFSWGISREFDYARPNQSVQFDLSTNPVSVIPRNSEAFKPANRVLCNKEIKTVWRTLGNYCGQRIYDSIRLIFAVGGQRVREVVEARCDEFDFKSQLWTIPENRTKNSRKHIVPLTKRAMELIQKYYGVNDYLFTQRDTTKHMMSTSLNTAVRRFCAGENIQPWTPRDIRRTCRTILSESGAPPHTLNRHFNHGFQDVGDKHYNRSNHVEEKTIIMKKWDTILAQIIDHD